MWLWKWGECVSGFLFWIKSGEGVDWTKEEKELTRKNLDLDLR